MYRMVFSRIKKSPLAAVASAWHSVTNKGWVYKEAVILNLL